VARAPVRSRPFRLVAVGLLVAALASAVAPQASATTSSSTGGGTGGITRQQLQREVERTLEDAGYVGLSVEVRDGDHRIRARAGEAVLDTGRPVPFGGSLRAGSATKSFVATVVLQLIAEGRLSLDDTVEEWLPGVVTGNGNDGGRITIRHLLQHTSGIHNYTPGSDTEEDFERARFSHFEPEQLVAGAMQSPPDFSPPDPADPEPDWGYSNPNYVLAGLIIERVTGRSWAEEVDDRIVRPLRLRGTYAPGDDPHLPRPHAHTYMRFPGSDSPTDSWTDTTVRNMTWGDAAGALVTTERDLDRFFTALFDGRLLPPEQLAAMRDTVPVGEDYEVAFPGLRYGLGLMQEPLSCGGHRWGHGGDIDGGTVRDGVTEDGRRSIVVSASGTTSDDEQLLRAEAAVRRLVDMALCRGVR
jgi:D-alanyl-D-alanine carboxypeptidase